MISPRLFVCSGAKVGPGSPSAKGRRRIDLDSIGPKSNVNIRFENVTRALHQHPPPRLVDFLEIASYVFSADCATERGEEWTDDHSKEAWGRDFAFVIPVRDPAFWSSPAITSLVTDLLSFLSDDKYSFTFVPLQRDRAEQQYFEFTERKDWPFHAPERVVMFSWGPGFSRWRGRNRKHWGTRGSGESSVRDNLVFAPEEAL
jgi:hypothetical protein